MNIKVLLFYMLLESFTYSDHQSIDKGFFLPEVTSWPMTKDGLKKIIAERENLMSMFIGMLQAYTLLKDWDFVEKLNMYHPMHARSALEANKRLLPLLTNDELIMYAHDKKILLTSRDAISSYYYKELFQLFKEEFRTRGIPNNLI